MIYIVSGPSSVGKSFALETGSLAPWFPDLSPSTPVIFPAEIEANPEILTVPGDLIIHYNVLRPYIPPRSKKSYLGGALTHIGQSQPVARTVIGRGFRFGGRLLRNRQARRRDLQANHRSFDTDNVWKLIEQLHGDKVAVVLVAPLTLLLERIQKRRHLEGTLVETSRSDDPRVTSLKTGRYPSAVMRRTLDAIDLVELYRTWCKQLDAAGIPWHLVESRQTGLEAAEARTIASIIGAEVTTTSTRYSRQEITEVLDSGLFEYQHVDLPYGLNTPGDDGARRLPFCCQPTSPG